MIRYLCGTYVARKALPGTSGWRCAVVADTVTCAFRVGAGEGNRTLMTSLEGWGSAIELRPRAGWEACARTR